MDFQVIRPTPVSWSSYWQYSPTNRQYKHYTNSRGKWPPDDDRSYIKHDPDIEEARALISGIFLQALRDSQTTYKELVTRQHTIDQYHARQWLSRNWSYDSQWLDYLDLDSVWFTKYIRKIKDLNWPQFRYDMRFMTQVRQQKKFVNGLLEAEEIISKHIKRYKTGTDFFLPELAANTVLHRTTMKEALVNIQCKGIHKLKFYTDKVVCVG